MTYPIPFTNLAAGDRVLEPDECASLAERAAALLDPAALAQARAGGSVVLWQDEHSVSWLNAMPERRDTGYHDHDGSAVGIHVLEGSVTNEGLPIGGPRRIHRYGPGDSFSFPGSGIHRMDHDAGSITVHVYSPPLLRMGAYLIGDDGVLARHTMSSAEELRPLSGDAP